MKNLNVHLLQTTNRLIFIEIFTKMFKPRTPFDPMHIIFEICAFQCVYYAGFTIVVLILDYFSNYPFSFQQVFNPNLYGFSKYNRRSVIGCLFASISSGVCFSFVEGRSKKALDYMSTVWGIHLAESIIFGDIPTNLSFWFFTIVSCIIGTLIAEFVSMKFELKEINLEEAFNSKV